MKKKIFLGTIVMMFWLLLMGVILIDEYNYQYTKDYVEQKYVMRLESEGCKILSVELDPSRLWECDYQIRYTIPGDNNTYGHAGTVVEVVW